MLEKIIFDMGINLAKLHNADIIHGDLTTSNILVSLKYYHLILRKLSVNPNDTVVKSIVFNSTYTAMFFIDFGLSYVSSMVEDKAVDLYVLKRAIISANPKSEEIV